MIKTSVIGATGYAGAELVRLLASHPQVEIAHLVSHSYAGQDMNQIYKNFEGKFSKTLDPLDIDMLIEDSDCIFTSLPHSAGGEVIAQLYNAGKTVIDLSGDYRYNDAAVYEKWYGAAHPHPELLKKSVYGLPELHREEIKKSKLIGNPGCYTTCSILALAPLAKAGIIDNKSIIIDAKSGSTGAGRSVSQAMHFCEVNESVKAYKVATHRHTSEIEQELSLLAKENIQLSFTPHLLPINRGILATSYANLTADVDFDYVYELYMQAYSSHPFVVICQKGELPEIKHVAGSNYIHIGFVLDMRLKRIIVVSVIDNLIKGAAGQAIQNMNLIYGLDETTALNMPAWYL